MIQRSGHIIAIRDGLATVRVERASACSSCGTRSVCGAGSAAGSQVSVPVPPGAHLGDRVTLCMASGMLTRAALLAYLLPALTTLFGAALLSAAGDLAAVAGALCGLGLGLVALRFLGRRQAACDPLMIVSQPLGES
jgi:sigma-E factor negative regulatory protein RseC